MFSTSRFVCCCVFSLFWGILRFLIGIGRTATMTTVIIEGILRIFDARLPIVIYTGHSFLSPAKFKRCVPLDMKIKGTSISPSRTDGLISISTLLSSSTTAFLCLPPPVCSVHFGITAFRWSIAVGATLMGINAMLGVGWLLQQPSHASDDVLTPIFDRPLVIVIPSHILESVYYPLPTSLIIWHASHKVLDAIPMLKASGMQCGVFFLQLVVIVCHHTIVLDPTPAIFVLLTHCKQVVGIFIASPVQAFLSVAFTWLRNIIAQQRAGAGEYFCPWQRRLLQLRHAICNVFILVVVGKRMLVFDGIIDGVESTTLSELNSSGRAANSYIPAACNLKVFRMV